MLSDGSISIDFETFSSVDIKSGLPRYFGAADADILCLAYRNGDEVECWVPGEDPNPWPLFEHVKRGGLLRAFNAAFEWQAWNEIGCRKYGWPPVGIEQFVDTMAEVQAMNLPGSLERCGIALGMSAEKQKSQEGKNLIRKLCVLQKPTKNQPLTRFTPKTHPALFQKLYDYCVQDVIAEEAIAKKVRRLTNFEQRLWVLTQQINARGIPVAVPEIENIVGIVEAEKEALNRELRGITKREVLTGTNRAAMLKWINGHPEMTPYDPIFFEDDEDEVEDRHNGDYFVDMQKATVAKALERDRLPNDVRRVLEIRQRVCQTSTKKYSKILKIVAADDTIKGTHLFHGAGTGRWASRAGLNVQNLFRPTLSKSDMAIVHEALGYLGYDSASLLFGDKLMEAAASAIRGVIKAPIGYELIDADYSSVENRVASWLAGQDDKLAMFLEGLDEYKTFGAFFYDIPYAEVTAHQRQLMKPIILGGIFGLGAAGLVEYAENYGVKMTLEQAKEAIKILRAAYDKVRECWYACGDAAVAAVKQPGTWFPAGERMRLICHKNFLWLQLPSGRNIAWAAPRVAMMECPWTERVQVGYDDAGDAVYEERPAMREGVSVESVDTFTRQWCRHKLIGSSIYQSGVQGTARDVLANGLFNAEEGGYDVRLLTHDEITALMPIGKGSPEELGELMCRKAPWMEGLPLAAEGWAGPRFRK